jgi:hypothetical protein
MYNPGIAYHGDQFLYGAISGVGDDFMKVMEKRREIEKDLATSDTIVGNAYQQGLIDDDTFNRYQAGSKPQKQGIAFGVMSNIHDNMRRTMFDQQEADKEADRQMHLQIAGMAHPANAGVPQPLILPDGSAVPDRYFIPGAQSVIDTRQPSAQIAPGTEVRPGWIWNGRELVQSKSDDITQMQNAARRAQLGSIDQQIATAQGEIDSGNTRPGPDWLPFGTPYETQVKKLQAQRNALLSPTTDTTPPPSGTPSADALKVLAQRALMDPNATPEQKAAARRILGL